MPTTSSRRNNAPVNSPRSASLLPDPLICIAIALGVMGLVFFAVSFVGDNNSGETGETLARLFAGSLFISGLLLFLLGFGLLYDERGERSHYAIPMLLGSIIGGLSSALFVAGAGSIVAAPFALAILALRPLRQLLPGGRKGAKP